MPADPTLAALPVLRELAEREAREAADVAASVVDPLFSWSWMSPDARERAITVRLALLSDLSRPASRDAVCRLVAERVGLDCPGGALLRQTTGSLGGWVLVTGARSRAAHEFTTRAPHVGRGGIPQAGVTHVPELLGVVDPAEALRLIAPHVLGERP